MIGDKNSSSAKVETLLITDSIFTFHLNKYPSKASFSNTNTWPIINPLYADSNFSAYPSSAGFFKLIIQILGILSAVKACILKLYQYFQKIIIKELLLTNSNKPELQ